MSVYLFFKIFITPRAGEKVAQEKFGCGRRGVIYVHVGVCCFDYRNPTRHKKSKIF